jgi:hypothetical protein
MKWYELEDLCPICNQEEDNHKTNCPNNTYREKKVIKKVKTKVDG